MALTVTPTLNEIYKKLGDFIASVLPAGVQVIQLPVNRVPMPAPSPGFVGMHVGAAVRIMTNLDQWDPEDVNPTEIDIQQAVRLSMQLDCYGAGSAEWAVILSTVLRDEFGVDALAPLLAPLYADDPRFAPLDNGEEEYEARWIVSAYLQYNPVVATPMQFANTAEVGLINVDERYPPS